MQICLIRFFSRSLFEQNHQRNKFAHCLIYRQNSFVKIEKKEKKRKEKLNGRKMQSTVKEKEKTRSSQLMLALIFVH